MEKGFLSSNSKVKKSNGDKKDQASLINELSMQNEWAAKFKNIDGKFIVRKAIRGANLKSTTPVGDTAGVKVRNDDCTNGMLKSDSGDGEVHVAPTHVNDAELNMSSFASILQGNHQKKTVKIKELHNEEIVEGATLAISYVDVEEVRNKFANTLYGYFIGKRIAFPLVEKYVKNTWAKFGLKRVMMRNGFLFFQFSTPEGMEKVLENGPWLIRLVLLMLNIWSPTSTLKKDETSLAPAWVKLHNVPIVNDEGFVEVKNRKKKGENVNDARMCGGIRLPKPTSNIQWQKKQGNGSKTAPKATTNGTAATPQASGEKITPTSNAFDVLTSVEADDQLALNQSRDLGMAHDSLWEKFKASKEASSSKSKSTSSDPISSNADYDFGNPESDEDEVFDPNDTSYMSSFGGGNQLEDDFSDGYEAQVYDLPGNWMPFVISLTSVLKVMVESRYGYMKSHMKTVKNGQTRTQERKSEQKAEAKAWKSQISSQSWSTEVNKTQNVSK
ncbi:zinc knuckle CX2CX4HX4C containing protein [Tanacetum coccineum]